MESKPTTAAWLGEDHMSIILELCIVLYISGGVGRSVSLSERIYVSSRQRGWEKVKEANSGIGANSEMGATEL